MSRKRLYILAAAAIVVIGIVYGFVALFNVTSTPPMLGFPVKLSRSGSPILPAEVASLTFTFQESISDSIPAPQPRDMKPARPLANDFLVYAGFSITQVAGITTTSPKWRSLFLQLNLHDGTSFSLRIPVVSDPQLQGAIQIDLPEKQ